uniref:Uncharacterized protein n=1 Tax=Neolamprologus brichardi TaxID=32507 RepID=A0A3Q4GSA1_NEOBR
MSVTVSKADGVTVLTLTSDPQSPWPPLCQIFKNLCYSPVCCTVSQHLRGLNRASETVLGTLQIMIGLLNIGFGLILYSTWTSFYLNYVGFPFWLGALFIVSGIVSILAGQLRSSCLMGFSVFMNIAGGIFAITAIVLYGRDLRDASLLWICDRSSDDAKLLTSLDITLITLALLQLAVNIRYAIWGIRALCPQGDKDECHKHAEIYKPVLKEVLMTCPGA